MLRCETKLIDVDLAVMLANSRGTPPVRDRCRAELCKGPRITKRLPQLRVLYTLPIVAGGKLWALDDLSNRRYRCDEQVAIKGSAEQFRLLFWFG